MTFALALAVLAGCPQPDPPEILAFSLDVAAAAPGDTVIATIDIANWTYIDEESDEHEHEHEHDVGDPNVGHVHLYLDSLQTNPLTMMYDTTAEVEVPDDAELGDHAIIARLHDAGHFIIEPQVTAEADLEVVAP